MSGRGAKSWHFEVKLGGLRGIAIVRGGKEITDRQNKSVGPLKTFVYLKHAKRVLKQKIF